MDGHAISLGSGETRVTTFIGRAAEDLPDGSVRLKVIIPQLMPAASGSVEAGTAEVVVETQRPDGTPEQVRATTTNTITASFIGESNLKYPPTVRKGEQVVLYQFGDSDLYYWRSMGRDPELRMRDVWRVEVSNKTARNAPLTDDNTYYLELNTKTSSVTLKTSNTQGEKARYLVNIDGKAGQLSITDNLNNSLFIDSTAPQVRLANGNGSMLDLFKKSVFVVGPEDVVVKAGRQVVLDSPVVTQRSTSGGGVCRFEVKSMAIAASNGITMEAPTIGFNGQVLASGSIMANGLILAPTFAVGSPGGTYPAATTNIVNGTGASPAPAPNATVPDPGSRHSAAVEDLIALATHIKGLFDEVNGVISVPVDTSGIIPLATAAKMDQNKGT